MRNRKLALRRESVTELGGDDLGRVAGGASTPSCYTCIVDCVVPLLIPAVGATSRCFTHHSVLDCLSDELCQH